MGAQSLPPCRGPNQGMLGVAAKICHPLHDLLIRRRSLAFKECLSLFFSDGLLLLLSSPMGPGNTWVLSQHGCRHSHWPSRRMRGGLSVLSHHLGAASLRVQHHLGETAF